MKKLIETIVSEVVNVLKRQGYSTNDPGSAGIAAERTQGMSGGTGSQGKGYGGGRGEDGGGRRGGRRGGGCGGGGR